MGKRLFTWDGLKHLILPSVSLSTIMLPLFIRLVRAEMMEVLETEYIKFALRFNGLTAIAGVSFALDKKERLGIVGESGDSNTH